MPNNDKDDQAGGITDAPEGCIKSQMRDLRAARERVAVASRTDVHR